MKAFRVVIAMLAVNGPASAALGQAPVAAPRTAPATGDARPVPRTVFIETMNAEFKQRDADRNGSLTKKEIEDFQRAVLAAAAQNRNRALFASLDTDKNGTLTPGEFAALPMNLPRPNAAPLLAQMDINRDGQVTLVEYRAGKLTNFDRMDADKDGFVSVAEMKAAGIGK